MGFKYILYAFLIFTFHIRFNGFYILPDFVGFIIMYKGFKELSLYSNRFVKASKVTCCLVIVTLPSLMYPNYEFLGTSSVLFYALTLTKIAMKLYVYHHLCLGIRELLEQKNDYKKANVAETFSRINILYGISTLIAVVAVDGFIAYYIAALAMILFRFGMIFFIHKCYKEYDCAV